MSSVCLGVSPGPRTGCSKTEHPHGRGLVSDSLLPALTNDKMTGEVIFCLQMHEKFMKKM